MADSREFKIRITGDAGGLQEASRGAAASLNNELTPAVEKTGIKHKEWRDMVRGLRMEFPELYHVAHLALHPISLAVGGVTAAWALWTERVKEGIHAMARMELPQHEGLDPKRINAAAEAWRNYAFQIAQGVAALNSVEKKSSAAMGAIDAALRRQQELISAQGAAAQAWSTSEGARSAIGLHVEHDKREAEFDARQKKIDLEKKEAADLQAEAAAKRRDAGKLHLASADEDAEILSDMKEDVAEAKKAMKEAQGWKDRINNRMGGALSLGEKLSFTWDFYKQYGVTSGTQALAIENENISNAQAVINRYNARRRQMGDRNFARGIKSKLMGESSEEEVKAAGLLNSIPGEQSELGMDRAAGRRLDVLNASAAGGRIHNQLVELEKELQKTVNSHGLVTAEMIKRLRELQQQEAENVRRIQNLEGQSKYGARPLQ